MQINQSLEESIVPLLSISSIKKLTKQAPTKTQRYNREPKLMFLVKSHTSSLPLRIKNSKARKKNSENNVFRLKINKTFDFIASNIIPYKVQTKSQRNFSLTLQNKIQRNRQNFELGNSILRNISQKKQKKKNKLLNQLMTNYKLQKIKSKQIIKQQNSFFATQFCELQTQRNNQDYLKYAKVQTKSIKRKSMQAKNSFTFDPDLKVIVQDEIFKLSKLKNKINVKINQFNLVNYYQRSNYQKKLKNIKVRIKK